MNNLVTRSVTGIIFVALMVGGILWNEYSFLAVFSIVLAGTLNEYFNITAAKREPSKAKIQPKWLVIGLSLVVFWKSFGLVSPPASGLPNLDNMFITVIQVFLRFRDAAIPLSGLVPCIVFILFAYELFAKTENPFGNIGWYLVGISWVLVPVLLTNEIYFKPFGPYLLVAILALIWIFDSASYACGSILGRTKMFERVSPKKTVEGFIGGAIFTLGFAWFFNHCPELSSLSNIKWIAIAIVVIFASLFGDLVESLLKRSLNLKDSGSIMPGHGGFLDRFDAYFFTIPFVYTLLWLFSQLHNEMVIFDYLKG